MAQATQVDSPTGRTGRARALRRRRGLRLPWHWVGILPFVVFIVAFQLYPSLSIIVRSFLDQSGRFTFDNIASLNQPIILNAYLSTIKISLITAAVGGLIGLLLAWAITLGGLPRWVGVGVISFCGVAANFAGIPLAFAFIATVGKMGLLSQLLNGVGVALYPAFTLYGFWGLCITYTYFQIPLMLLVMVPAFHGLRVEWHEAAESLGASRLEYWRHIGIPVMMPSLLGALLLLFANAFGTHATAYALVGGGAGQNLVVTVMVGAQFSTDGFANPGLGNALALGMIVVIGLTIFIYTTFRRRAERWMRH